MTQQSNILDYPTATDGESISSVNSVLSGFKLIPAGSSGSRTRSFAKALRGTCALVFAPSATSGQIYAYTDAMPASDRIAFSARYKFESQMASSHLILKLGTVGGTQTMTLRQGSTNTLVLLDFGGSVRATSAAITPGTEIGIQMAAQTGTGVADGLMRVRVTKMSDGTEYLNYTQPAANAGVGNIAWQMQVGKQTSSTDQTIQIWDDLFMSNESSDLPSILATVAAPPSRKAYLRSAAKTDWIGVLGDSTTEMGGTGSTKIKNRFALNGFDPAHIYVDGEGSKTLISAGPTSGKTTQQKYDDMLAALGRAPDSIICGYGANNVGSSDAVNAPLIRQVMAIFDPLPVVWILLSQSSDYDTIIPGGTANRQRFNDLLENVIQAEYPTRLRLARWHRYNRLFDPTAIANNGFWDSSGVHHTSAAYNVRAGFYVKSAWATANVEQTVKYWNGSSAVAATILN